MCQPDGRTLSAHNVEGQQHYMLGLEGKALGDPLETFTLHSMTKRDDKVGRTTQTHATEQYIL